MSQASRALVHAFETGALVAHQAVFAVPVDPILDVLGVSGGGDVGEGGGGVVSNGRGCVPLVSLGVDAVNTRRCFPRSFRALSSTHNCAKVPLTCGNSPKPQGFESP